MILLKNDCYLTAYKNCDFIHVFDLKETITSDTFTAKLQTYDGSFIDFTINKDNTFLTISLTSTQINTIGLDICDFWVQRNSLPLVKGTISIKPFN